jgi:dual specificity MAP kinase phosphatase
MPDLPPRPRKILLHCNDGYTESTMLAVAYHSFATGQPVPQAWLDLHTARQRNLFAYPSDVALLSAIAPRLLCESPFYSAASPSALPSSSSPAGAGTGEAAVGRKRGCSLTSEQITDLIIKSEPRWFTGFDGSFPSRVLPYMYLGNLGHANNPDLLRALGIGQMLSVGETAMWRDGELEAWGGEENVCVVQGVQDNGIDTLAGEFERCLGFIGTLTLYVFLQLCFCLFLSRFLCSPPCSAPLSLPFLSPILLLLSAGGRNDVETMTPFPSPPEIHTRICKPSLHHI